MENLDSKDSNNKILVVKEGKVVEVLFEVL